MKKSVFIFSVLALALTIFSCDKDPEFVPGEFIDVEKLILETDRISARYQVNDQEVKFIIEDLLNVTDNRTDEYPAIDFFSLRIDMNNDNMPDNNIDKSYSISQNNTNCMQYVLNEGSAATGCIAEEGYTYNSLFKNTNKSSEEHIVYELILNKDNIFTDSETVGLIFVLNGDDAGGAIPLLLSPLYAETIEFSL